MSCGCNKKKDPKELISRAKDKTTSNIKSQRPTQSMPLVSTAKKPVLKPKK